jgi:hypothetical protein
MPLTARHAEIVAQCLHAADLRMTQEASVEAGQFMNVTFAEAARWVATLRLNGEDIVRIFLQPMQNGLAERHAIDDACRLYWDFFDAFWFPARGGLSPTHRPSQESKGRDASWPPCRLFTQ